jgi:hypothetical protein
VLLRDPQGRFDPQALLCPDPARDPLQIIRWFVQRWQVEVTFREVRDHLGVETQRQGSDRAIARTTPCLLALFSIVTLLAARLDHRARSAVCIDAWYRKPRPAFADTLAAVRRQSWREQGLLLSRQQSEVRKRRPELRHGIAYALCHAAYYSPTNMPDPGGSLCPCFHIRDTAIPRPGRPREISNGQRYHAAGL